MCGGRVTDCFFRYALYPVYDTSLLLHSVNVTSVSPALTASLFRFLSVPVDSLLSSSEILPLYHSPLKIYLFHKSSSEDLLYRLLIFTVTSELYRYFVFSLFSSLFFRYRRSAVD